MGLITTVLLFFVAWSDALVAVVGESFKTYVREVWRFGSQLVSLLALLVLRFLHRGAYEYQLQRRNRIRRADSLSAALAAAAPAPPPALPPPGAHKAAGALCA